MAAPKKKRVASSPPVDETLRSSEIQELMGWWHNRKATLQRARDGSRVKKRTTFHIERRWVEAIQRQSGLDGLTHTQIVNEALRQYFEGT